ncbi:MAG: ATP-binding protein [Kiloniellales bacterium]
MQGQIDTILDLVAIQSETLELCKADERSKPFDVQDAVIGAMGLMGEQLRLRDIKVSTDFPKLRRKAIGHLVQLEQVVLNLLTNARDAIDRHSGSPEDAATAPREIRLTMVDDGVSDRIKLVVTDTGCGIMVNSTDTQALTQSGTTSCLVATKMKVAGGYAGDCVQPGPITGVKPRPAPLAALEPPPHGGCDDTGKIRVGAGQVVTPSPGVYCGSIEAVEDGVINFEPGLYVLDGAGLKVSGQGTLTGDGVTFHLTENSGASDNISIQAGATVSLKAATSGTLAGILFYQDRNRPTNVTHHFTGGSNMERARRPYRGLYAQKQ